MPWERKVMADTAQLLFADEPESIRPLDVLHVDTRSVLERVHLARAQGRIFGEVGGRWLLTES